jgi:hypothetical protein
MPPPVIDLMAGLKRSLAQETPASDFPGIRTLVFGDCRRSSG